MKWIYTPEEVGYQICFTRKVICSQCSVTFLVHCYIIKLCNILYNSILTDQTTLMEDYIIVSSYMAENGMLNLRIENHKTT